MNIVKFIRPGPGGYYCPCCFPAPRSYARKKRFKAAKYKANKQAFKEAYSF